MDEKLSARAKLIYERDSSSPLYLKTADYYLQINDLKSAYSILEYGLKIFPNHPLAFILMGKVQNALGNIEKTESSFRKAGELLNSEETFVYYKNKYNLPDRKSSPFDSSRGNLFINTNEDFKFDEELKNEESTTIENNLSELSQQLLNARIERNKDVEMNYNQKEYNPDKSKLATETLAKIYLSQGQKSEALKVYEILVNREPEKKDYYLQKIKELK